MAVRGDHPWGDNWRVLSADASVCVDIARSAAKREAASRELQSVPAGARVVLRASAPGAKRRCKRFAAESGLELERAYLAFPSAGTPAYLVEDAPAPVRVFTDSVLVTPPGTPLTTVIEGCLSILRGLGGWRLVRALAPGRVIVGTRT
ncbi:MAG: hypothetical protein ACJ77E_06345 [Gaiellaceae bacterium]